MSLYKGNNLISGHQVLYSTTGQNTDGAMTQKATTQAINSVATDLDSKADTDLTNVTDTGYIKMAGASMPSSTYINLATPVNNSQYVAPADGYFTLRVNQLIGTVGMIRLTSSNNILSYCTSTGAERSTTAGVTIPVRKGVTVTVGLFGTNSGIDMFRFYYAVGSESEAS